MGETARGRTSSPLLLTQHYLSDQVKKNQMGGAFSTYMGEVHTGFWVGKPEGGKPLGRPRRRWQDNIKIYLREIEWWGDLDLIGLAQEQVRGLF